MQLLAKVVLAIAGVVLLDVVHSVLKLETSSTEAERIVDRINRTSFEGSLQRIPGETRHTKAVLIDELVTFGIVKTSVKAPLDVKYRSH